MNRGCDVAEAKLRTGHDESGNEHFAETGTSFLFVKRIQHLPDEADGNGEPVEGLRPGHPFTLRGPARSVAGNHFFRHYYGPARSLAETAGGDAHGKIENVLFRQVRFPVRYGFQERLAPPRGIDDRVFGRAALRATEHDHLPHNGRAIPFRETQPDG